MGWWAGTSPIFKGDILYIMAQAENSNSGEIYRSENMGRTWREMNFAPGEIVHALAVHPMNETILYAGTAGDPIWTNRVALPA